MEPLIYEGYRGEKEQIAAIEYYKAGAKGPFLPHSVFTVCPIPDGRVINVYDFDWCKRDHTIYFHNSGTGRNFYLHPLAEPDNPPRSIVWWDKSLVFPTNGGLTSGRKISNKTVLKWGYAIAESPLIIFESANPFNKACDGDVEYCDRCRDNLPTENLCQHIFFCDKCGDYSKPGDRCEHRRTSNR